MFVSRKSKTIFFPSNTLFYGISRDGSKNFNLRTCEHMILGQLRVWARQAKNAPLLTNIGNEYRLIFNHSDKICTIAINRLFQWYGLWCRTRECGQWQTTSSSTSRWPTSSTPPSTSSPTSLTCSQATGLSVSFYSIQVFKRKYMCLDKIRALRVPDPRPVTAIILKTQPNPIQCWKSLRIRSSEILGYYPG